MKSCVYAVKNGKKPGIYRTWDECKAQVHEFPGAVYKKFDTYAEALEYLGQLTSKDVPIYRRLIAYIGSGKDEDILGVGIVFYTPDTAESTSFSAAFSRKPCQNIAKWAPYFLGCYYAIQKALAESYQEVTICTTRPELKFWCRRDYGSYTHMSNMFKTFISNYSTKVYISFDSGEYFSKKMINMAYSMAENAAQTKLNFIKNPLL